MHGDIGWWVGPGKEAAAECSWAAEGQWVLVALASVGSFDVAESVMMQAMVLPRRESLPLGLSPRRAARPMVSERKWSLCALSRSCDLR